VIICSSVFNLFRQWSSTQSANGDLETASLSGMLGSIPVDTFGPSSTASLSRKFGSSAAVHGTIGSGKRPGGGGMFGGASSNANRDDDDISITSQDIRYEVCDSSRFNMDSIA
jgi:hypothetical protein